MPNLHDRREATAVRSLTRPRLPASRMAGGQFLLLAASLATFAQAPPQTASGPRKITADQLAEAESVFISPLTPSSKLGIFLQAADQGNAAAKRDLGLVYQSNDAQQALQWFEAAAVAGDIRAYSYTGDFYLDPKNGKPDPKEAQYWYQKSYKARDARGTIALAMLSCNGIGTKKDDLACGKLLDAANGFQKNTDPKDVNLSLAADDLNLGIAYQNGKGVRHDNKTAASWYAKSAALGSVPGAVAESRLYVEKGYLPQDLPHALAILDAIVVIANRSKLWYQEGFQDQDAVTALYTEIGAIYESRGPNGMPQAVPIYKSAAALGNATPYIALGLRYAKGDRVTRNLDTAYTILTGIVGLQMKTDDKFALAAALQTLADDYAANNTPADATRIALLQHDVAMERMVEPFAAAEMAATFQPPMVERYPNLSAPDTVSTAQDFAVNVSLNAFQFDNKTQIMSGQQDTGQLQITLPAGMTSMPIQVDLIAPGMTFTDGSNSATLTLDSTQPNSLPAVFHLRSGAAPSSTMLIASLSYHQNAIAQLARPIATVAATSDAPPAPQSPIVTLTPPTPITGAPSPSTNGAQTRSDNTPLNSSPIGPKLLTLSAPAPQPTNPHSTTKTASTIPATQPRTTPIVLDPSARFADLTIHETAVDDTMYYTFDSPGLTGTVYGTYPGVAGLKAKVAQIYDQLQVEGEKLGGGVGAACAADRAKGGGNDKDPNCQESVLARGLVQGIGTHLYNDLAPAEFRTIYQLLTSNHIRINSVTVVTNNPTLPWELMLPQPGTDQFLGLTAGIVRENASLPQLAQPGLVDFSALAVVAPNYSGTLALNTAAEVSALKKDFPDMHQTAGDAFSVSALIRNAPQGIIHFAGHGKRYVPPATTATPTPAAPASTAVGATALAVTTAVPAPTSSADTLAPQVAIALEDDDMTPDTFVAFRAEGRPSHPFYFLNACDLGQSDKELNYIDGWAPALMQSGASGYLGALFEVGDDSATHFATYFYAGLKKDLASNANWSMSDLVTSARKSTYMEANDPTALAYVLYAKPFMELVDAQ